MTVLAILALLGAVVWAGCEYQVAGNPDVDLVEARISPIEATVFAGGTLQINAFAAGGVNSNTVTWSITGDSSSHLVTDGFNATYHAPDSLAPHAVKTVVVTVQSSEGARAARCTITVLADLPTEPGQAINLIPDPFGATLLTGNPYPLSARVLGNAGGLRWSVTEGGGSVSQSGLYTPPELVTDSTNAVTVQAASVADPSRTTEIFLTLRNLSDTIRCFSRDVAPILIGNCGMSDCHGVGSHEGEFDAASYQSTLHSVTAGNARASRLYRSITELDRYQRMPPPPHQPLSPHDVQVIGQWINEGAHDCP